MTHPFAIVGMSLAWLWTRFASSSVNLTFSSAVVTGGYVASVLKLSRNALSVLAIYGFVPTMNGRASRERTRVASLRGISANAYDTESSTDSLVNGRPKESNSERLIGRGGEVAYLDKSCATSLHVGCGGRR